MADLVASGEANIRQVLWVLKRGAGVDEVGLPPEAAAFMRANVRRGIPLPAELRAYRLGHAWLWDRWTRALQERVADPEELIAAQEQSSAFMFAYIDRISDVLVEEYGTERERMMRGADQLRAETVRAILAREPLDEEALAGRLGYECAAPRRDARRERHERDPRPRARRARGGGRARRPASRWSCPRAPRASTSGAGSYEPRRQRGARALRAARGRPRRVRQAGAWARRLPPLARRGGAGGAHGVARRRRGRRVVDYARVELVSLLASDLPRARAFVASRLGPLAAPDEPTERLRETVLVFLAIGGRSARAAKELYVHQNTVAYRVKRAEELLGRRVTEDPVELICALTLADTLGPAVLSQH